MSYKIKISEFLLTKKNLYGGVISEIEINEEVVASGAYGLLYDCVSVNGKEPSIPQIVKIFKEGELNSQNKAYKAIIKLQSRLANYFQQNRNEDYKSLDEVPALKAVPIFSFEGTMNGCKVKGFSAINLLKLGFISFDDISSQKNDSWKSYRNLSFKTRYQFCFHLVKGFQILSDLNYVHADINPANIFINLSSGELSMIDFDGGNIIESIDDQTQTFGKLNEGYWMAPEIYENRERNDEIHPDLESDRWSVSVGLHYLIFMYDPFFFIKEHSKKCKESYLKKNKIYPINLDDENISENAAYSVEPYMYVIKKNVPVGIHNELVRNYEEGFFYPRKRTHYYIWAELFKQTQTLPIIEYFNSDQKFIFKDNTVRLFWKASDCIKLSIDNQIGDVTGKNEIRVKPDKNMTYCLTVRGHFGVAFQTAEVTVLPLPVLEYLKVPTPDLGTLVIFPMTKIKVPEINLSVEFDSSKLCGVPTSFISLSNDMNSMQALFKKKPAFWSIQKIFNKITEKILSTYNYDN